MPKQTYDKVLDLVFDAVEKRGYTEGYTNEELVVRQAVKAVEELSELLSALEVQGGGSRINEARFNVMRGKLMEAAQWARELFDDKASCKSIKIAGRDDFARELCDVLIPCHVAQAILDVGQAEVLGKARGDIGRGVR